MLKSGQRRLLSGQTGASSQGYLNEYAFRYNGRENEQPMFETLPCQIVTSAQ